MPFSIAALVSMLNYKHLAFFVRPLTLLLCCAFCLDAHAQMNGERKSVRTANMHNANMRSANTRSANTPVANTSVGRLRVAKASMASVHVESAVVLQKDQFTLGDIAFINAVDEARAERLRLIPLGFAPVVGAMREITRERLRLAMIAADFADVALDAPPIVRLTRASQIVDANLLRDAIEEATLPRLRGEELSARLVQLELPPQVEVPAGQIEVRAYASNMRDYSQPVSVRVEIKVADRVVRRINTLAHIEVTGKILVARRDLATGATLGADDVLIEERVLVRDAAFYVRDKRSLRGTAARGVILRGEAITNDALVRPLVVKAGDRVRIVSDTGAVKITVAGEARGSGRVGDRVQVKNVNSNQMLQGVVMDEGLVQVQF